VIPGGETIEKDEKSRHTERSAAGTDRMKIEIGKKHMEIIHTMRYRPFTLAPANPNHSKNRCEFSYLVGILHFPVPCSV
jgi:hypothetical protein